MIEDFLHLPMVSLTPVANLELRISPRIFEKFETTLIVYSGAWEKLIHEKNQKSKISWHCPFKPTYRISETCPVAEFQQEFFFMYFIQHCVVCRPSDSTVSEDAGIEPRTVATSALAVRRFNHSARSHPHGIFGHSVCVRVFNLRTCHLRMTTGRAPLCIHNYTFCNRDREKS